METLLSIIALGIFGAVLVFLLKARNYESDQDRYNDDGK